MRRAGAERLAGASFRAGLGACALAACALAACADPVPSEPLTPAGDEGDPAGADAGPGPDAGAGNGVDAGPETTDGGPADGGSAGDGGVVPGAVWRATADVNLRTGPATTFAVTLVIPRTGLSAALDAQPTAGFLHLRYAGREGYSSARYHEPAPAGSSAALGSTFADRARASVGFSYWWGHGRWSTDTASEKGSCTGNCPTCTHTGPSGADCSGMVGKAWLVPGNNWSFEADAHPYSTANFYGDTTWWAPIDRANAAMGDAMVYRSGGAGHIFLYESGDPWGNLMAIECKGCASGCVRGFRTASTAYKAIRRSAQVAGRERDVDPARN